MGEVGLPREEFTNWLSSVSNGQPKNYSHTSEAETWKVFESQHHIPREKSLHSNYHNLEIE